jgi:hypothetical protein
MSTDGSSWGDSLLDTLARAVEPPGSPGQVERRHEAVDALWAMRSDHGAAGEEAWLLACWQLEREGWLISAAPNPRGGWELREGSSDMAGARLVRVAWRAPASQSAVRCGIVEVPPGHWALGLLAVAALWEGPLPEAAGLIRRSAAWWAHQADLGHALGELDEVLPLRLNTTSLGYEKAETGFQRLVRLAVPGGGGEPAAALRRLPRRVRICPDVWQRQQRQLRERWARVCDVEPDVPPALASAAQDPRLVGLDAAQPGSVRLREWYARLVVPWPSEGEALSDLEALPPHIGLRQLRAELRELAEHDPVHGRAWWLAKHAPDSAPPGPEQGDLTCWLVRGAPSGTWAPVPGRCTALSWRSVPHHDQVVWVRGQPHPVEAVCDGKTDAEAVRIAQKVLTDGERLRLLCDWLIKERLTWLSKGDLDRVAERWAALRQAAVEGAVTPPTEPVGPPTVRVGLVRRPVLLPGIDIGSKRVPSWELRPLPLGKLGPLLYRVANEGDDEAVRRAARDVLETAAGKLPADLLNPLVVALAAAVEQGSGQAVKWAECIERCARNGDTGELKAELVRRAFPSRIDILRVLEARHPLLQTDREWPRRLLGTDTPVTQEEGWRALQAHLVTLHLRDPKLSAQALGTLVELGVPVDGAGWPALWGIESGTCQVGRLRARGTAFPGRTDKAPAGLFCGPPIGWLDGLAELARVDGSEVGLALPRRIHALMSGRVWSPELHADALDLVRNAEGERCDGPWKRAVAALVRDLQQIADVSAKRGIAGYDAPSRARR